MKLPADLQKYMWSTEYDQGSLIASRAESILSSVQTRVRFLTARPELDTQAERDEIRRNLGRYQDTKERTTGVCQCLAIKWLKYKMKEQRQGLTGSKKVLPDARVDRLRLDTSVDKAGARQTDAGQEQVYTMAFDAAMKLYNVTAEFGWEKAVTLKEVSSKVKGKTHGYFVAGITAPKYKSNHAIAIYTSGGKLGVKQHAYVFDPNYGEMAFPLSDFGRLFSDLVQSCYHTPEDGVKIFVQLIPK